MNKTNKDSKPYIPVFIERIGMLSSGYLLEFPMRIILRHKASGKEAKEHTFEITLSQAEELKEDLVCAISDARKFYAGLGFDEKGRKEMEKKALQKALKGG